MIERWIHRNEGGTRQTLDEMRALVLAFDPSILISSARICPRELDSYLRRTWNYVPDGDNETIRAVPRMLLDRYTTGSFQGDCDDAAVMAAAILRARRWRGGEAAALLHARFVAVRPPRETFFVHVFTVAVDNGDIVRIDPTAPLDADYQHWEQMVLEVF